MQESVSEVARIRQQIAAEQMAARLGLQGLNTGTGRHDFITKRQERVAVLHEELEKLVGNDAIALVAETLDAMPDALTRSNVLTVLRQELRSDEEVELICADLQVVWEVIDTLKDRFGDETVRKMVLAPPFSPVQEITPS